MRHDPALGEPALGDGELDLLDGDRAGVDGQRAGCLAGRRADAARHLGQVVRHLQAHEGFLPVAPVHEVVPLGDQVVDRAPGGVAERDAAVHAAGALRGKLLRGDGDGELLPRLDPFIHGEIVAGNAGMIEEARRMSHQRYTSSVSPTTSVSRVWSLAIRLQRLAVVDGHHLHEPRQHLVPVAEDPRGVLAAGVHDVPFHQLLRASGGPPAVVTGSMSTISRLHMVSKSWSSSRT